SINYSLSTIHYQLSTTSTHCPGVVACIRLSYMASTLTAGKKYRPIYDAFNITRKVSVSCCLMLKWVSTRSSLMSWYVDGDDFTADCVSFSRVLMISQPEGNICASAMCS